MRWTSLISSHACFFISSTPFMLLTSGSEVFIFNITSSTGMCLFNSYGLMLNLFGSVQLLAIYNFNCMHLGILFLRYSTELICLESTSVHISLLAVLCTLELRSPVPFFFFTIYQKHLCTSDFHAAEILLPISIDAY